MSRLRRSGPHRVGLTGAERFDLMSGSGLATSGLGSQDEHGDWRRDEEATLDAWLLHRDKLLADAAQGGLIPWAARHFEGMPGKVSPYEAPHRPMADSPIPPGGATERSEAAGQASPAGAPLPTQRRQHR
jgi:hypothetical protein